MFWTNCHNCPPLILFFVLELWGFSREDALSSLLTAFTCKKGSIMKKHVGLTLVSMTFFLYSACGFNSTSITANVQSRGVHPSSDTQNAIRETFKDCVISLHLKNNRVPFDSIKKSCHAEGLAQCAGVSKCESEFESATQEVMTRGKSVDCDSGFCTILF